MAHPADSLARHIRVGCGATVTICRNYRLANLLVVERRASKSRGAKAAVKFLAHPADSLARHIRVGCGATVTICRNYRLANLLVVERRASKSRVASHKLNRHAAVEFLAHPARFERAVPAFGVSGLIKLNT